MIATAPVVAAAVAGGLVTRPNVATWYAALTKPALTPPSWLFGPVWTLLYALMAFAAYRLLRLPAATPGRGRALAAFFVQLALNATWSWLFFGMRSPALGLIDIMPQLAAIVLAIRLSWPLDRAAGWALVPLALWVLFATWLNAAVWWLNR